MTGVPEHVRQVVLIHFGFAPASMHATFSFSMCPFNRFPVVLAQTSADGHQGTLPGGMEPLQGAVNANPCGSCGAGLKPGSVVRQSLKEGLLVFCPWLAKEKEADGEADAVSSGSSGSSDLGGMDTLDIGSGSLAEV